MKVTVLLIACLIAGSYAQDTGILEKTKNTLTTVVDHVKEQGKVVLTGLLEQLKQSGSQLLQTTLLKLLETLGTGGGLGKRDVSRIEKVRGALTKFMEMIQAKKQEAKGVMAKGLEKLEAVIEKIKNLSFLKQHISKTEKEVDDAVAHHVTVTRRFLEGITDNLLETLKQVGTDLVSQLGQQLLQQVLGGLAGAGKKRFLFGDLTQFYEQLKQLGTAAFNQVMAVLKEQGLQAAQQLLVTLLASAGKRELHEKRFLLDSALVEQLKQLGTDATQKVLKALREEGLAAAKKLLETLLANLGTTGVTTRELHPALQSLVDFFKPHVQTVVGSVKQLGETLKGHANNLWNTVQTHAGQLQGKLQGHVDELKQHGKTLLGHGKAAVDAVKAAVTDILQQTLTNAKGTIGEATKTIGEAGKVVAGHVTGALTNGSE